MTTEVLTAVVFVLVLSTLALLLWGWKTRIGVRRPERPEDAGNGEDERPGSLCPLCGEFLPRGVRVHSVVFPGREFDLMRIYGCPHCRDGGEGREGGDSGEIGHSRNPPVSGGGRIRRCPYCGEEVPPNGYVMARVYRKMNRRTHVNVYGCTVCKPGRG